MFEAAESSPATTARPTWRIVPSATRVRSHRNGAGEAVDRGLRKLFMRTLHPRDRWSAAYNLAVAYINLGDLEKACGWASRSAELAEQVDDPQSVPVQ